MEYNLPATRQVTVTNSDGTTSEEQIPVTIGIRAEINPSTTLSDPDSEPFAGQGYAYPGKQYTVTPFNEEDGNFIITNGLDIVKTNEIDKLFTIMCESGNNFFENHFMLHAFESKLTHDLCYQLTKGAVDFKQPIKVTSLKTVFYPYVFRCSIVSNVLKFIDRGTVRSVTTERDLSDRCVICISNYDLGQDTRSLPCLHKFHRKCIDEWIVHDRCCPFCRVKIQFCGNNPCKIIKIDGNLTNDFEVPPSRPSPPSALNNPSGIEEDDIDRMFNLSFGDLDMLSNEQIDLGTFRETVEAILNIASERHHVDVVAMFDALQPGMANIIGARAANAVRPRSAAERRSGPTPGAANTGFRVPFTDAFRRDASAMFSQRTTEGPSVKRQKSNQYSTTSTPMASTSSSSMSSMQGPSSSTAYVQTNPINQPKLVYVQANAASPWVLSEYLPNITMNNQPAQLLSDNQTAQNESTIEGPIELDDSFNSDTVDLDVSGLSQESITVSDVSSCDVVHVETALHTVIVENCICCDPDEPEIIEQ